MDLHLSIVFSFFFSMADRPSYHLDLFCDNAIDLSDMAVF